MINKVILLGRVGQDPELRYLTDGSSVASFSVATTESFKKDDKWQETTEWHNISVFGKTADFCKQYILKGNLVYIEGKNKTRKWQDKSGADRSTTEVIANTVKNLTYREKGETAGVQPPPVKQSTAPVRPPQPRPAPVVQDDDEDIPF